VAEIWRRFTRPAIKGVCIFFGLQHTSAIRRFGSAMRRSRGASCTAFGVFTARTRSGVASAKIYRSEFEKLAVTDGTIATFQNGFHVGVSVNLR
jgi:hypothetical protein